MLLLYWNCPSAPDSADDPGPALVVSKEVYDQTFAEVNFFLKKIHSIILKKDFDTWKTICTEEYLKKYSTGQTLQELSEKPQLKEQNIVLKNIKDYFVEVFIPSRANTKLDKIEFVTKFRVKALSIIADKAYVVYLLEKDENNEWKIGIW